MFMIWLVFSLIILSMKINLIFLQIHFHYPNSNTLDEFVPKDLLPNEYGGQGGTIEDIKNDWIKRIEDKR